MYIMLTISIKSLCYSCWSISSTIIKIELKGIKLSNINSLDSVHGDVVHEYSGHSIDNEDKVEVTVIVG